MENGNVVDAKLGEGVLSEDLEKFITVLESDYPYYISPTGKVN